MTFRTSDGRFEKVCQFFKVEDGVAYGWAIICTDKGAPYWDLQNDHIPEDEMTVAALDFMKASRVGSDQHTGEHVGDIVFAFPVTKASTALGIASDKTGLLIGYQPQDPVHLDMIANGERTGFSIGGYLIDYDAGEIGKGVWSTEYQEALPDSSYLYVVGKGKAKTRLFPVKDAMGKLDGPHVESALKRIPTAKLDDSIREALLVKANGLKAELSKLAKGSPDPSDVYVPQELSSKKRGKIYRRFKIDEISLVTKPAMAPATVGYVKSATIKKADYDLVFTSSEDGHQHVIDPDELLGAGDDYCPSTYSAITGATGSHLGEWHSHQIIVGKDGTITIQDNAGHGHTVEIKLDPKQDDAAHADGPIDVVEPTTLQLSAPPAAKSWTGDQRDRIVTNKSNSDNPENQTMTITEADHEALKKSFESLTKSHEQLTKLVVLSDSHRSFAKSLSDNERDAFVSKTHTERDAIVKAAIEYTSVDGTVFYKGEDPRLIKMAKSNDDMAKSLIASESIAKAAVIAKLAAEEMSAMAGEPAVQVAVMTAIESISDENVRKAAHEMIKGANLGLARLSKSTGTGGAIIKTAADMGNASPIQKADQALKTAVEAYQKANNLATYAEAFVAATEKDAATRAAYDALADARNQAD